MKYLQFNGALTRMEVLNQTFNRGELYMHLKSKCLYQINIQTRGIFLNIFDLAEMPLENIYNKLHNIIRF